MPTYDLNPRDVALYQRSNEYLSRLNALDPYSREYANVYNDYVDTIDQLSNRDFRASLGSTLLEFAPMTRPRTQPKASEPVQQARASEPVQLAPADNILYRERTETPEPTYPLNVTPEVTPPASLYLMSRGDFSPKQYTEAVASMYQNSMNALKTAQPSVTTVPEQKSTPYGITVSNPDWTVYPYTSAEPQPSTVDERTVAPYSIYGAMGPVLQTARENAQGQAKLDDTDYPQAIDLPPMMIEGIKPLVRYINNTTNTSIKRGQNTPVNIPSYFGPSPFMYSPPYAKALSELSEWGKDIPGVYSWY